MTCEPKKVVSIVGSVFISSMELRGWPICPNCAFLKPCNTFAIRQYSYISLSTISSSCKVPIIVSGIGLPRREATPVNSGKAQISSFTSCIYVLACLSIAFNGCKATKTIGHRTEAAMTPNVPEVA